MSGKSNKNGDLGGKTIEDLQRDLTECKRELPKLQKLYADIGKALSASGKDDPFQGIQIFFEFEKNFNKINHSN